MRIIYGNWMMVSSILEGFRMHSTAFVVQLTEFLYGFKSCQRENLGANLDRERDSLIALFKLSLTLSIAFYATR